MTLADVPQGLWLPPRVATLLVAASDALDRTRAQADYICDGAADQVQINAALNALPANGGRVMLSEGIFTIDDPITIPANNITLEGQGRSTFIDGDGLATGEHAIVISGVTHTAIKKLAIQTQDGAGKTCHCIALSNGCNSFTIESVTIVDSDSNGIDISGTNILDGIIRDCSIEDVDDTGIYCSMTGGNFMLRLHVLDCFITSCGLDGMKLYDVDYGLLEGNVCYSNGNNGIYVLNTNYITIDDNTCILNTERGIYFLGVDNSTVEDNLCYSNTEHNIHIGGTSSHNVVEGNQCISANSATSDGIEVDDNCHENSITGNGCIGNGRWGIYVSGDRNEITGNHVCTSGDDGIFITGSYCLISSNYVYDNSQDTAGACHGIRLSGAADLCNVIGNYCNNPVEGVEVRHQESGIYLGDQCVMVNIIGNYCSWGLGSGIELSDRNDDCQIKDNYCYDNDDYGIELLGPTAAPARCVAKNNRLLGNGAGCILDNGTDTALPEIFAIVPNPDAQLGTHMVVTLTDGEELDVGFEFLVPADFQELVRAQVFIVAGGTGNLRRSVATNWGKVCASQVYNVDTDTIAEGVIAVTINEIECFDISAALTGLAAQDLVGVDFIRHGDDVTDTVAADCYCLGFRIQYV